VKYIFLTIVVLSLVANASAEECFAKTESSYEGKSVSTETCVARVDDVIKTSADGYVKIHYIVQYKGQRLVVDDPLARSNHAVGEQISFTVGKLEMPADSRSQGFRTFYAMVYDPKPAVEECPP